MKFIEWLNEAKMENSEVVDVCKKLLKNGKDDKVKKFAQGLLDYYDKNDSFTPDQVSGLQNIMKNASFNLAESAQMALDLITQINSALGKADISTLKRIAKMLSDSKED
jgi:hypothetical protein